VVARVTRRVILKRLPTVSTVPDHIALLLARTASYGIVFIAVVYALSLVGIDMGPVFILILLFLVIAFFSLKPLLENFAAGIILQTRSPFEIGDEILSGEWSGRLVDINARATVIVTPDGKHVRLPNTTVLSGTLVNLTREGARRSEVVVGVPYGSDLASARTVIEEAVSQVDGVLPDPPVHAGLLEFDDSAITFEIRFWHTPYELERFRVRDGVIEAVDVALKANGIVVPFPQQDVWLKPEPTKPERDL